MKLPKLFGGIAIVVIMTFLAGLILHLSSPKKVSITLAHAQFESTALICIAEAQGLFARNGLNVTLHKYDAGIEALDEMLNGKADIAAGVAEFPVVGSAFQQKKVFVLGAIAKAEFIYLIARKDRGIQRIPDLKGKRVGTTMRTISHFHLGRFLNLHDMEVRDVTLVDLKTPQEWVNAIVNGEIDAVATAQPYVNSVKEGLGANAIVWPVQSNQHLYSLVTTSNAWIAKHPESIRKFLRSLAQAEEYFLRNPAEAKTIVQKMLNLDAGYMETVWSQNQFSLSLDQSLIAAMEDEARWMIKNDLASDKGMPNFLDYIAEDALKDVKPGAVNIIR